MAQEYSGPSFQGRQYVAEDFVTRKAAGGPVIVHLPSSSCKLVSRPVVSSTWDANYLLRPRRFDSFVEAKHFQITFITQRPVKVSLLYTEDLRVEPTDGLDQRTVRSVSDHGNEGADIHAIMWSPDEDDAAHSPEDLDVVRVL